MRKTLCKLITVFLVGIFLCACGNTVGEKDTPEMGMVNEQADEDKNTDVGQTMTEGSVQKVTYEQISLEEAKQLMAGEEGYIILDVRTQEEYASGHIPDAICVPNESIGTEDPEELPDKEQLILVYCRSGNRSKQASKKLAELGYTNVKEFGGIMSWDGEIER